MLSHSYDNVLAATKQYFNDDLATNVWASKYALKDKLGNYFELTPDDMHKRLAKEFARIDKELYSLTSRDEIYYDALKLFERVVPQGSPMSAIGNPFQTMSASNCVVVESPHDSMGGIMRTATELAQLYKRRCGVGVDISTLRPEGFVVNNAAKTTTGPVSFCEFYSNVTRMVCQDGRRGALMITMSVHHPDVESFAIMKMDKKKVTGANVSVRLSDEFLKAVEKDEEYEQRWPCEGAPVFTRKVRARQVWATIVNAATLSAEPGLIFWDPMTSRLPAHSYPNFRSVSTNPCSEICLSAYDSCRLISINLLGYVANAFTKQAYFDFESFKRDVALAVQMSDNLVDIELELIEQIKSKCEDELERALWDKLSNAGREGRRIGLGTHGLADMLNQIGIRYDSSESLKFCDRLYETFRNAAYSASVELAKVRGPFPAFNWEIEKHNEFIRDLPTYIKEEMSVYGRRNIAILTQAPTGSTSLLSKTGPKFARFGTSSGVEPLYKQFYIRRRKGQLGEEGFRVDFTDELGDQWMEFKVYHNNILNWADATNSSLEDVPPMFVEANDIDWKFRVALQGIEQKYIDHSISSTINLPKGTKSDVVGEIYLQAWKSGLKGITVYVDGSRSGVLIDANASKIDPNIRPEKIVRMMAPKRPKELACEIHHTKVKGKAWICIVGLLDGEPYETFGGHADSLDVPVRAKLGKLVRKGQGKYSLVLDTGESFDDIASKLRYCDDGAELGWVTRLVSTSLRHGTPIEFLVEQLNKEGSVSAINKVLARVLKKYIPNGTNSSEKCPSCGNTKLVYQEGCKSCKECGYSKCG